MNEMMELKLELRGIDSEKELHDYLFRELRFPEYYGSNWDAFDECIRDASLPAKIKVLHFEELEAKVPRGARLLKQCLKDFTKEFPERTKIEYCQQPRPTDRP
jgi:ribonuclease inhibitor